MPDNKLIENVTNVMLGRRMLSVLFRKSHKGMPLVVVNGFPDQDEAVTPNGLRDLAEILYQIARDAEREVPASAYYWGN